MPYGAGLSDHPLPIHAAADPCQQVMDHYGSRPDLGLLFTTRPHVEAVGSDRFCAGGDRPSRQPEPRARVQGLSGLVR
jgi:hypothetical protein